MGTTVREEKTTTQQKTEPWAGAQPYYADLYASAEAARKSGAPAPYPGSSVVDWSSQMQDAYRQMEATARNGSSLNGTAQNTVTGVMNGSAYDGTPKSTYENLQAGLNPGSNPYSGMVGAVANGALANGFGGQGALQAGANWRNPGVGATALASGTINNTAGNQLLANGTTGQNAGMSWAQLAAQMAGSNPALSGYQGATGFTNAASAGAADLARTAGTNPAVNGFQAQTGYTNSGLDAAKAANTLANTNPALDAFKGQTGYTNGSLADAQRIAQTAGQNSAIGGFANAAGYQNSALNPQQAFAQYLATNGNPAAAQLQATANGDFLNANPYLDQAIKNANSSFVDQFNNSIAPGIDSQMAAAGRFGSGAYASLRNSAEKTTANAMATNAGEHHVQQL
ncbi:hypothetical protein M2437_002691 [Methylorubrum pseudosasae]|nr:hypothetical protein [Methylorubrum pseudosasae]